ncbi:hypothetical protein NIES3974_31370 [Calothrix sp. NIES-3974]|nr:hypothetical protein NIES3974_31370 [Calothrix sp. NIES-3974]
MYNSMKAIVTAGKTRPVKGTKIEGKNDAAIINIPIKIDNTTQTELTAHPRLLSQILKIFNNLIYC